MRRSIFTIGAAAVSLTVALAGCSGGDTGGTQAPSSSGKAAGPSSSAAPSSGAASANSESVAWMDGLCGEMVKLAGLSNVKPPNVKPGDIKGAQKALSGVIGKFESTINDFVAGLKELPPAPEPAGDKVKQDLIDTFQPIGDKAAKIKENLDAAAPGDKQAVATAAKGLQSIGSSLQKMDNPLKRLKGTQLLAAGKQAPKCKKLGSFAADSKTRPTS